MPAFLGNSVLQILRIKPPELYAREYCVQYGETDFNFVSRLMEDDGIFYFFEHTQAKHTLILADDNGACDACKGVTSVRLRDVTPKRMISVNPAPLSRS